MALTGPAGAGKTTLFKALTAGRGADGVGMVDVPDERLVRLADTVHPKRIVHAQVRVIDAPPGSSAQRMAAAREADVVVKVVRAFGATPDPVGDLESIELDMALNDLATVERRIEALAKEVRAGRKEAAQQLATLERAKVHLDQGHGLDSLALDGDERGHLAPAFPVSLIPSVVVVNVAEDQLGDAQALADQVAAHFAGRRPTVIACQLEMELALLPGADQAAMRETYGLTASALGELTREVWAAGGLMTFFTAGEPEARAWPCAAGAFAPVAAGVIHSDFEKSFIRAEVTSVEEFVAAGGMEALRAQGKLRVEGRDYHVQDGDVVFFRVGRSR